MRRPWRCLQAAAGMIPRPVVMQGIALLAVVAAGAGAFVHAQRQPMDAGELRVVVSELRSEASESRLLLERLANDDVSARFTLQHATHLGHKASAARDKLLERKAEPRLERDRVDAAASAVRLVAALTAVSDRRIADADTEATLNELQHRLEALEHALAADAR